MFITEIMYYFCTQFLRSVRYKNSQNQSDMSNLTGKITQIIGPVIDVSFHQEGSELPNIMDALEVTSSAGVKIVLECQQHIGEDTIRTIAMDATDGLQRGLEVISTGSPIKMPIGEGINGRLFNVVGDPIDGMAAIDKSNGRQIHSDPPLFENLSTSADDHALFQHA